jgi:WD40 repeat protein
MEQEIQPQQPSPLPPDNKSKVNLALVFGVATVVLTIGVGAYLFANKSANTPSPSPTIPSTQSTNSGTPLNTQNDVFIATTENVGTVEDGVLNILIFNPVENKVVASKKISLDAVLDSASTESSGINDSVQYNPKTKEVFFSTLGSSAQAGSCTNTDSTCVSRLYKISLDQTEPTILFESKYPPTNWVVNSFDNSLLLSFLEEKTQSIKKINGQDGKVIFTKEYQIKENTGLDVFVLSKDGKYIYQASTESVDGKASYEILRLRKIDNSNGDITEQEIFGGEAVESGTTISPDNNYLAFYSGAELYIYEVSTKKLINVQYQGSIGNFSLLWSGDSKKLLPLLKNSLTYYDVLSAKGILLTGAPQQDTYVYAWAPSDNYFVYESQDGGIKIFDIAKNQVIDTQTKTRAGVKGISWY